MRRRLDHWHCQGWGIGKMLRMELVRQTDRSGFCTLQSSIFPENQASIAIHLQCGFRVVGRCWKVVNLHGSWRDIVLMERRSPVAGIG